MATKQQEAQRELAEYIRTIIDRADFALKVVQNQAILDGVPEEETHRIMNKIVQRKKRR
jgi:hypothetical protein